jgi:hypothetical protein
MIIKCPFCKYRIKFLIHSQELYNCKCNRYSIDIFKSGTLIEYYYIDKYCVSKSNNIYTISNAIDELLELNDLKIDFSLSEDELKEQIEILLLLR